MQLALAILCGIYYHGDRAAVCRSRLEGTEVDEWYYSTDGKQSLGPVSAEELGRILAAQVVAEKVLAWRPRMATCAGAASVPELKSYLQPPPRPPEIALLDPTPVDHERKRESSAVHPWRRYFARIFDLYLFALVFF